MRLAIVALALAQGLSVAPGDVAFDAASIKINRSGETARSFEIQPGGAVSATNVTVRHLMWQAYGVQDFQIVGGPDWAATDRFDITARVGSKPSMAQLRLMMRRLLADRFNLAVRVTTREVPILAMVMARPDGRPGPQLLAADPKCAADSGPGPGCGSNVGNGTLRSAGIPMTRLAGELTGWVERPVVDRTGLTGRYAVQLEWSPDPQAGDARPSLFTALQEQLGIRLREDRGPIEVIVIERLDRPTPD
jgi:uncharacterized protein (TIGR03435 family)